MFIGKTKRKGNEEPKVLVICDRCSNRSRANLEELIKYLQAPDIQKKSKNNRKAK